MEDYNFQAYMKQGRRLKLQLDLNNKVNKKLTKNELKKITNQIDIDVEYSITVLSDFKKMASELTLLNYLTEFDWGGEEGLKQTATCLLGEVHFGEVYFHEHFHYDCTDTNKYENLPDFNINQKIVVSVETHDWKNLRQVPDNHDERSYELIVYIPEF